MNVTSILKKRVFGAGIGAVALCLALGACGGTPASTSTAADASTNAGTAEAVSGSVTAVGSTALQPLAEAAAEAYMGENPDVQISIQGGGMMITARDTELDVVDALDSGADDYLAKPFGMLELVSRCRALLRRAGRLPKPGKRKDVEAAELILSPAALDGRDLDLTPRKFDLLAYLLAYAGETCSRDELLREVWGWDFNGGSRTVDFRVPSN